MRKVELDEFCRISYAGSLSSSPDGDKLCFIKSIADLEDNKYNTDLWLYEADTGMRKLTNSGADRKPVWLDNDRVAFFSNRIKDEGYTKTRIYQIHVHGGESELLLETCHDISQFKVLDDNHWLVAFSYHPSCFELQQQQDDKALEKLEKETSGWHEFDEIPFWSNGDGITNKQRTRLGILDLETKQIECLTDKLTDVYQFDLSPDKQSVAYVHNAFKHVMSYFNNIGLIHLPTKERKDLSHSPEFMYERCQFTPTGTLVMLGKACKNYGLNENAVFFKIDTTSGETTPYSVDFDNSVGSSVGSDVKYGAGGSGNWIFTEDGMLFSATVGCSCNLYYLKDNGQVEPFTHIEGSIFDYALFDNQIIFNALIDHKPIELYSYANQCLKSLTNLNPGYGTEVFLSTPEYFTFESTTGVSIDGFVMKPKNFNPSRRYPAILNIHGGPKTVYGSVYYHEMQYWASEGYAVLFCNPRGSDGKGDAFADIRGLYGTIDYDDLMSFVDEALTRNPWIRHDQLGVTGGSYGGFMTNWIVGHTQRFKAAATQRSIANWVSMYGTSDIGYYFAEDQVGTTPWTDVEKLWQHSPLKYADQIKTPMLVLHSEEDYRCWVVEGIQMFTALKINNVPSKMVMFHGENHELSRSGKPKNRYKRLKEITDWMNTYVRATDE